MAVPVVSTGAVPAAEVARSVRPPRQPLLWGLAPISAVTAALFVLPLAILVVISFWTTRQFQLIPTWTLENYLAIFEKPFYTTVFLRTLGIAGAVTALCILLGYPFAYFLTRCPVRWRVALLFLVIVPFWTSYVIRTYAWKTILGRRGVINYLLMALGLVDEPVELFLYNWFAVILVGFHLYIPFATLTLYASIEKLDRSLLEAARDLGAGPVRAFLQVTLPLTVPGIFASVLFVFIPVLGMYVTPTLVGGTDGTMIANLIVSQFEIFRLGLGAALSFVVTLVVSGLLFGLRRYVNAEKIFS